jgi:hypothetical protein
MPHRIPLGGTKESGRKSTAAPVKAKARPAREKNIYLFRIIGRHASQYRQRNIIMIQDNRIQSQQPSTRATELDLLDLFIGKWINEGETVASPEMPATRITTSDIYEWLPGRFFVLHTAYGRIGQMDVGGSEIIGYDPGSKKFRSYFFDSRGNVSTSDIKIKGTTVTWTGEGTGCVADFTKNGKVQAAHHFRINEKGERMPAMEVVLTKVV